MVFTVALGVLDIAAKLLTFILDVLMLLARPITLCAILYFATLVRLLSLFPWSGV